MINDRYVLTEEEALNDIKTLCELIVSICTVGKINPVNENGDIWDKVSVCLQDRQRTDPCHSLMNKYCYGWYIAKTKSAINQVEELKDFITYIFSNINNPVCRITD